MAISGRKNFGNSMTSQNTLDNFRGEKDGRKSGISFGFAAVMTPKGTVRRRRNRSHLNIASPEDCDYIDRGGPPRSSIRLRGGDVADVNYMELPMM